ncbi:MAG: hypothetical protein ACO3IY_03495 [Pelagibacteraceae bacterium]|jgi:hypothetical protein
MDSIIVDKVTVFLKEGILKGDVAKDSPMKLIAKGMEIMETFPNLKGAEKEKLLIKVIEKIAAGADGIVGTDDDIIPAPVVEGLKTILEKDLVGDVANVIKSAFKGEFKFNQAVEVAKDLSKVGKTCIPSLIKCFKK